MAKDRNGSISKEEIDDGNEDYKDRHKKSKRKKDDSSDSSDDDRKHRSKTKKKRSHRYDDSSDDDRKLRRKTKKRRSHRYDDSSSSYDSDTESGSESESLDLPVSEESEGERRRRKRRERESKERRRREKKKKREKEERRKKKEKDKKKKKKDDNVGKKGAVTNSWGKYGIIRETDMWNKRPEFTAWLTEVKQVNPETLPNWEEKQMFKEFMEDHNTATFPSKKFYNLDAYHCHQMEKEAKKGLKRAANSERTVFDDEEQRRLELQRERNRQKEEEIEALKRSMQSGMAQAMKDQGRLREEMAYQYKLGNFEAAAAIQRRLDPDVAM